MVVGINVCAWCVTGTRATFPTVMLEEDCWRVEGRKLLGDDDMYNVAPMLKH